jgi:CO dehydrogenase maturation factor
MKVAVAGKGGIGKTTISAALSRVLADRGEEVFAVDADSNNCLGYALGMDPELVEAVQPVSDMKELLRERAGADASGAIYSMVPEVADLIERFSLSDGRLRLLVMGSIVQGGAGCACPENATLKALLRELVDLPAHIIVDMEAGLEHLGRGTAMAMDTLLIVTDATPPALRTARRIMALARDVGFDDLRYVANRVRSEDEAAAIRQELSEISEAGIVSEAEGLAQDDVLGGKAGARLREEIEGIAEVLS